MIHRERHDIAAVNAVRGRCHPIQLFHANDPSALVGAGVRDQGQIEFAAIEFFGEAMAFMGHDLDLHIGITGWICDERRGTHLRELVRRVPPNRLMIETDAPYILPRDLRPKSKSNRNEPALLPYVLRAVATARGESDEELARTTTQTARAFFGLPARGVTDRA